MDKYGCRLRRELSRKPYTMVNDLIRLGEPWTIDIWTPLLIPQPHPRGLIPVSTCYINVTLDIFFLPSSAQISLFGLLKISLPSPRFVSFSGPTFKQATMASTEISTLFSVKGRNALVTGGTSGIGLMIAKVCLFLPIFF